LKSSFLLRLKEVVNQYPENIALSDQNQILSFKKLEMRLINISHKLEEIGVKEGDRIALWMKKSSDYILSLLACLRLGCIFIPIDEKTPLKRVSWILNDAEASWVLTDNLEFITQNESLSIENLATKLIQISEKEKSKNMKGAYIIYTSGSTGNPKGVLLPQDGILNFLDTQMDVFRVKSSSKVLQYLSIGFDASLSEIGISLLSGAELAIKEDNQIKNLESLVSILANERITHICLPPALLPILPIEEIPESLETIIIGGEVCPVDTVRLWASKFRIVNVYGPTEATVCSSLIVCEDNWSKPLIGIPIPNRTFYILDADLKPVDRGEKGELYLGGVGLATCYINQEKLTNEKFITYNGERIYKTGDLVCYHSDEEIEFLGRMDRQFKWKGNLIEPIEIEKILTHRKEIVFSYVSAKEKKLLAYLVLQKDFILDQNYFLELKKSLSIELPKWMVPDQFILLDQIPLNQNEKMDFNSFSKMIESRPFYLKEISPPKNAIEIKLTSILEELLSCKPIGVEDDFFLLGGDSLSLLSFVTECSLIGIHFPIDKWILNPTIRELLSILKEPVIERKVEFLKREAELPDDLLDLIQTRKKDSKNWKNILLTGATGYLGSRVLFELAADSELNLYCIVRNRKNAYNQIEFYLGKQGLEIDLDQIYLIEGDVSQKNFGMNLDLYESLTNKIDTVFHLAAQVNLILPYQKLKDVNVKGTLEVLFFCLRGIRKYLHYASTLSVLVSSNDPRKVFSEDRIDYSSEVYGGYAESKWVSEKILLNAIESGCDFIRIYRFGLITGDSKSGFSKKEDFFTQFLEFILKYRILPKLDDLDLKVDMTPLDYAAYRFISIAKSQSNSRIFHIANLKSLTIYDLLEYLKRLEIPIKQISKNEFLEYILNLDKEESYFYLLIARVFISDDAFNSIYPLDLFQKTDREFDFKNTNIFPTSYPILANEELIARYISFLKN